METKFEQLADDCTRDLHADEELALEVKTELLGHLHQAKDAALSGGKNDCESEEIALKQFGDSKSIAASLLEANFSRMKLRSRIKLAVKILILPLALLALFIVFNSETLFFLRNAHDILFFDFTATPEVLEKLELGDDERLICFGASGLSTEIKKQKAIWDKWPDNRMYMANYACALLADNNEKNHDFVVAELKRLSCLEPENAFYDFVLIGVQLPECVKRVKPKSPEQITDSKKFSGLMGRYLQALKKPYCRSYAIELGRQRGDIVRSKISSPGLSSLLYLSQTAEILLPHLNSYRRIAYALPLEVKSLLVKGNKDQALEFCDLTLDFVRLINNDDSSLIGVLVAYACAGIWLEEIPELFKQYKMNKEAQIFTKRFDMLRIGYRQFKVRVKKDKFDINSCGFFGGMLLTALGEHLSSEDLAPSRRLEYTVFDKFAVAGLSLLTFAVVAVLATMLLYAALRQRRMILFTPTGGDWLKIVLYALIVPLIYCLIINIDFLGGRGWGIDENLSRTLMQAVLPLCSLLFLAFGVMKLCNRHQALTGGKVLSFGKFMTGIMIGVTVLLLLLSLISIELPESVYNFFSVTISDRLTLAFLIILFAALCFAVLVLVMLLSACIRRMDDTGRLNFLPYLVFFMLLLSAWRYVLDWREQKYYAEDTLLFAKESTVFTPMEDRAVSRLRRDLASAIEKAEKIK